MGIILLAVVALGLIALIHFYLWKRLVRDATRPGRWRRIGAIVAAVLGLLVPATLFGTRAGVTVLAWPGYLWIALMFYLLVVLLLLEIPMLVTRIVIRRRAAAADRRAQQHAPAYAGQPAEAPQAAEPTVETNEEQPATDNEQQPGIDRRLLLARGAAICSG